MPAALSTDSGHSAAILARGLAALSAGLSRFLGGELVRRAFLVGRFAALAAGLPRFFRAEFMADPLAWAAWPPLLAISRCLNSSMEPKPRLPLGICSLLSTGPVLGRRTHQVILRFPALGTGSAAINLADMFRRVSSLETDRALPHRKRSIPCEKAWAQ